MFLHSAWLVLLFAVISESGIFVQASFGGNNTVHFIQIDKSKPPPEKPDFMNMPVKHRKKIVPKTPYKLQQKAFEKLCNNHELSYEDVKILQRIVDENTCIEQELLNVSNFLLNLQMLS